MDACIVICKANKPVERRRKVLFINARDEVTRKNAQSYLEDSHIQKIAGTYHRFEAVNGFSAIADIDSILKNDGKLSIALYVVNTVNNDEQDQSLDDAIAEWMTRSAELCETYDELCNMLPEESL